MCTVNEWFFFWDIFWNESCFKFEKCFFISSAILEVLKIFCYCFLIEYAKKNSKFLGLVINSIQSFIFRRKKMTKRRLYRDDYVFKLGILNDIFDLYFTR